MGCSSFRGSRRVSGLLFILRRVGWLRWMARQVIDPRLLVVWRYIRGRIIDLA